MAYGFHRFLTTHTGSLPRPDDLIWAMFAKEEGVPVDRAALASQIGQAVAEVVKKQVESGVDLVNDGEMSKPSYEISRPIARPHGDPRVDRREREPGAWLLGYHKIFEASCHPYPASFLNRRRAIET